MAKINWELIGNDLDLINEIEDEMFRGLIGSYLRMSFLERKRKEKASPETLAFFKKRVIQLVNLQHEMVLASMEIQKENIRILSDELQSAHAREKVEYSEDLKNFDKASIKQKLFEARNLKEIADDCDIYLSFEDDEK